MKRSTMVRGIVLVGALIVLLASAGQVMAAKPTQPNADPAAMIGPLARNGFVFTPSDAKGATSLTSVDADRYVAQAIDLFGDAPQTSSFSGVLTVDGYRTDGPSGQRLIEGRGVVAVRMAGLSLYPMGARTQSDAMRHTEMIVFFDATTGDFLLATTNQ